jgi:hypothetical protein
MWYCFAPGQKNRFYNEQCVADAAHWEKQYEFKCLCPVGAKQIVEKNYHKKSKVC